MKRIVLCVLVLLMVLCSFSTTYASSLWQENETVKDEISLLLNNGDFDGLIAKVDIYTLYNSDDTSVAGSIGFFLTNILYGISNFLGELCLEITHFAKSFNIYEYAEGTLDNVFGEFEGYFLGENFVDGNGIIGLAMIFAALLGILSLLKGKLSEGIGRIGTILLICIIAFLLYANTTETLKKARGITDDINTEIEASISNGSDIYSQMADILIVKPYNQAQYGESDPLNSSKGLMKDYPSLYQYFLTTDYNQVLWFGHGAGQTSIEAGHVPPTYIGALLEAARGSNFVDASNHTKSLVAEDLAGESSGGNEKTTNILTAYDGQSNVSGSLPLINNAGGNIGKHFANDSHWFGVAGEMFVTMLLTMVAMFIFIGLAVIDIIGQLLVILLLFLGIPIILWAMFKGFDPIKKAGILIIMGFSLSVISTAVRSGILLMLDIFDAMTGGDMVLQLLLMVVLAVMLKLFGWQIVDVFGVQPQARKAVIEARQLKNNRQLKRMMRRDRRDRRRGQNNAENEEAREERRETETPPPREVEPNAEIPKHSVRSANTEEHPREYGDYQKDYPKEHPRTKFLKEYARQDYEEYPEDYEKYPDEYTEMPREHSKERPDENIKRPKERYAKVPTEEWPDDKEEWSDEWSERYDEIPGKPIRQREADGELEEVNRHVRAREIKSDIESNVEKDVEVRQLDESDDKHISHSIAQNINERNVENINEESETVRNYEIEKSTEDRIREHQTFSEEKTVVADRFNTDNHVTNNSQTDNRISNNSQMDNYISNNLHTENHVSNNTQADNYVSNNLHTENHAINNVGVTNRVINNVETDNRIINNTRNENVQENRIATENRIIKENRVLGREKVLSREDKGKDDTE